MTHVVRSFAHDRGHHVIPQALVASALVTIACAGAALGCTGGEATPGAGDGGDEGVLAPVADTDSGTGPRIDPRPKESAESGADGAVDGESPGADAGQPDAPVQGLALPANDLPPATLSEPYDASLAPSGGTGEARVTLAGGELPAGLQLDANGRLTGTPTEWGDFRFKVQATSGDEALTAEYALRVKTRLWLVYSGADRIPAVSELFAVDVGGGLPYRSVRISADLDPTEVVGDFQWSADGKYISYYTAKDDRTSSRLYRVDMSVSSPVPLFIAETDSDPNVVWQPSGSDEFLVTADGRLYVVVTADGPPYLRLLSPPNESVNGGLWSPASDHVLYVVDRSPDDPSPALFLIDPAGTSQPVPVVGADFAYWVSNTHFLAEARASSTWFFGSLDGALVRANGPNAVHTYFIDAAPNGTDVYTVSRDASGSASIYRTDYSVNPPKSIQLADDQDLREGAAKPVDLRDAFVMLSPDAKHFYYRIPEDTETERITEADVDHGYALRDYIVPKGERPDPSSSGRLFMPQVRGDELDLAICGFSDSGLSCPRSAGTVPVSTKVTPMGFAPDDSGLLYFVRDGAAASDSLYLVDLRHDVHPAVPVPTSDGTVTVNAFWSPGASHRVACLTQSPTGKKDLSVVDVTGFLPSSPVSASGPGIVERVAWQPSWP